MNKIRNKYALITGTSQGIGAAISEELIERGCNVCMHYFSSDEIPRKLKRKAENKGLKAIIIRADLTGDKDIDTFISSVLKDFKSIDILVNNSGGLIERRTLRELDISFWNKVMDLNLNSMMRLTRGIYPFFNRRDGSSIINISSLAGRKGGGQGSIAYATAKGAMITWTRHLSTELAPEGIRVNCVAPGFIQGTRFHKTFTPSSRNENIISKIPLGRSGTPKDVARGVAFLASEYNGFITGITLDINGGVYVS